MFNTSASNYFEIIVILTGTLESTGLTMQAQKSYLSTDVMNGFRLVTFLLCPTYDCGSSATFIYI